MLIVILIVGFYWYSNNAMPEKPGLSTQTNQTISTQNSVSKPVVSIKSKRDTKKPNKPKFSTIVEDETNVNEAIFDSDPVVDASMVLEKYSLCISYLDERRGVNSANFQKLFETKLGEKQKRYFKNFKKHCKQVNKAHPEYQLTNRSKLYKWKTESEASSLWGQIIKGDIDPNSLPENDIRLLLKQNDSNILTQAPGYLREYYAKVIHWDLEAVLNNHHYDYINHIRHYAHNMYLCNLNGGCDENSSVMGAICYMTSESCGLNYQQFISTILTPGQQSDVALALDYLSSQYQ